MRVPTPLYSNGAREKGLSGRLSYIRNDARCAPLRCAARAYVADSMNALSFEPPLVLAVLWVGGWESSYPLSGEDGRNAGAT